MNMHSKILETNKGGVMRKLSRRFVASAFVTVALLLIPMALPATAKDLEFTEKVIAGGPDKFVEVRHVVLKGSNFEIGKKLGEIAKRDGVRIMPSEDKILNRALEPGQKGVHGR
jgi:hypothetical protein